MLQYTIYHFTCLAAAVDNEQLGLYASMLFTHPNANMSAGGGGGWKNEEWSRVGRMVDQGRGQ